jgi:chaperonin GroEL (HSP60 family)
MLREVAERTGDVVGDGTTTAALLAHAIFASAEPTSPPAPAWSS